MNEYLTPDEVCSLVPGMTKALLAQLRYTGNGGPVFYKPTPRKVVYKRDEVLEWLTNSARTSTIA